MHYYTAFGFSFAMEWPLEGLVESVPSSSTDVTVTIGKTPKELANPQTTRLFFQVAPNEFLLQFEGVANYYVTNGNSIVIEPLTDDRKAITTFLLGTTLTALLHQQGVLPLHASVVQIGDACVAFSGKSGMGKSTLAAHFAQKGYKVLSDDVCAIRLSQDGIPYVYPAFPQFKLWKDALSELNLVGSELIKVRDELQKFRYPSQSEFLTQPLRLTHLYLLHASTDQQIHILPQQGMLKFQCLIAATHKPQVMIGNGKRNWHFQMCQKIANTILINDLKHSYAFSQIDELITRIQQDVAVNTTSNY